MAPEADTSIPEAAGAAVTARADALRADILGVLEALQRAADQLFDYALTEQLPRAREAVERLAPLVDGRLTGGRATVGAGLGQVKGIAPHVAAARRHPWLLTGGALLVGYLVAGGGPRAPITPPAQPRRPQPPPASGQS